MYQLNTARFARLTSWLQWQRKSYGVFLRFPQYMKSLHVLFYVHDQMPFKIVFQAMNIPQTNVRYPVGVNQQTLVMDFLIKNKKPQFVQIILNNGERKQLRNSASDYQLKIVKDIIDQPNSIYSYMTKYLQGSTWSDKKYSPRINYFLNQFYMRLTAQTYCKIRGLKAQAKIGETTKNQILSYIGQQYENHSPALIRKASNQRDLIQQKVEQTKKQIQAIQKQGQQKYRYYKYGAIVVTTAHILSFGYMIFFVQWLGWDIIQPLTYSVGVLYTLLGIRFYRKYRTDRTGQSIRDTVLKIVMKPNKLINLKDLKFRLALQEAQLRRISLRARLLKNRINFRTTLSDAFSLRATELMKQSQ